MNAPTRCKVGDLAIVISANIPENIGNIVEIVGPPTGRPLKASWECATWHVRTISGRRTLVYRLGNGSIGIVKRHAEEPVPDFRLRPFLGIQVVYEQGRAGERDIADGMFVPVETHAVDEVA
jgi:hypothetical protein